MFLFVLIPAWVVVAALSIWLARASEGGIKPELPRTTAVLLKAVGFTAAIALSVGGLWMVPLARSSDSWDALLLGCTVVVLAPLALGIAVLVLLAVCSSMKKQLVLIASGALFASAVSPLLSTSIYMLSKRVLVA